MGSNYCVQASSLLWTLIIPIVVSHLAGLGVWAQPHLPPFWPNEAGYHGVDPSEDYHLTQAYNFGLPNQNFNDAEDGVGYTDFWHGTQPPSWSTMAIQPPEVHLAHDNLHDFQSDPNFAPGSRMIASEAQITHDMLTRQDLIPSFESNEQARLDRTHQSSDPSASGFSFYNNSPFSFSHEQQFQAHQPQFQHFALTGQPPSWIPGPGSPAVTSSPTYYEDSIRGHTDDARPLENSGSINWHDALHWLEEEHSDRIPGDVSFPQQTPAPPMDAFRQPDWLRDFESSSSSTLDPHSLYGDSFSEERVNYPGHLSENWWTHSLSESIIREQGREVAGAPETPVQAKREIPDLQAQAKVDRILRSPQLPARSMSEEFLGRFTSSFEGHVASVYDARKNYQPDPEAVPGMPALKIYRPGGQSPSLVLFELKDRKTSNKTQPIMTRWKKLMAWLLFANTAILRELGLTRTFQQELASHHKLSNWLFNQSFHPSDSYPTLGLIKDEVTIEVTEEKFGTLQKIIVSYMESEPKSVRAFRSALEIIRIYYDHSDEFQNKLNNPTPDIESIVARAIDSKIRVETETLGSKTGKLGNLMIPGSDFFVGRMKPEGSLARFTYHLLDYKKGGGIMQRVEKSRLRDNVSQIGFIMNAPKLHSQQSDPETGLIQQNQTLPDETGSISQLNIMPGSRYVRSRLNFFMLALNVCHRTFSNYLQHMGVSTGLANHEEAFFTWFENLLFKDSDDNMTIFGHTEQEGSQGHSLSNLDAVQCYLIGYVCDQLATKRAIQVAFALVGYWYKNQRTQVFISLFKTDLEYWTTMKNIFEVDLTDPESVSRFLRQNNAVEGF